MSPSARRTSPRRRRNWSGRDTIHRIRKQKGIGRFQFNFALPNIAGLNVELIDDPDVEWPE